MYISVTDFSFFGKDRDEVVRELKQFLSNGHTVCLKMSNSTSLSNDLGILDMVFAYSYQMYVNYRLGDNNQFRTFVTLEEREE